MSSSTSSDTFPYPSLTPIQGKPTRLTLTVLQKELYANASAMHSTEGGGEHGHLGLLMSDDEYKEHTKLCGAPGDGFTFQRPDFPGSTVSSANKYKHEAFTKCSMVENSLKKQMLAAVESRYFAELEHPVHGMSYITPYQLLNHLMTTYGKVTPEVLEKNRATLQQAWSPTDPIEDLWIRIKQAQALAMNTNQAISDATAILLTLEVIEATKAFDLDVRDWKKLKSENLTKFKVHFNEAHETFIETNSTSPTTTADAGYHGANAAKTVEPAKTQVSQGSDKAPKGGKMLYYCHTHGIGLNPMHTSATCKNPAENHDINATLDNISDWTAHGCLKCNVRGKSRKKKEE